MNLLFIYLAKKHLINTFMARSQTIMREKKNVYNGVCNFYNYLLIIKSVPLDGFSDRKLFMLKKLFFCEILINIYKAEAKMKKVFSILLLCFLVISLGGCGSERKDVSSSNSGSKGSLSDDKDVSYLDYIDKVEVGDSLDKINEVIGSEGKVLSDNATYTWDIGNGGFTAVFKANDTSSAISLDVSYDNEDIENKNVKIKDLNSIKAKVSEGIHYDEFKELLGGVDGILVSKGSVTKGYVWRNPDGSVVDASFGLDDNICNSFTGTEK